MIVVDIFLVAGYSMYVDREIGKEIYKREVDISGGACSAVLFKINIDIYKPNINPSKWPSNTLTVSR